jgi:hypothetical protein
MYRLKTKTDRLAARYIPKNAHCVTLTDDRAAYVYPGAAGRAIALCYIGSASKPAIHTTYRDIDRATEAIATFLRNVDARKARKIDDAATRKTWRHDFKVGEILYTSWGYDQTNIDFYVITATTAHRVTVQALAQDSEATGPMAGQCWPRMPLETCGEPMTCVVVCSSATSAYAVIKGHHAWRETGRSHYFSTYA